MPKRTHGTVAAFPPHLRVFGLDAEWVLVRNAEGRPTGGRGPVALLQIGYFTSVAENSPVHAIVVQLRGKTLPDPIRDLFADPLFSFTGRAVGGDVAKLRDDFKCAASTRSMKLIELGRMARTRDVVPCGTVGLDKLVELAD